MALSELDNELNAAVRFFAPTMAEAMRKLSRALGKDAMLLTSKNVKGGVEVYGIPASAEENYKSLTERRKARRRQRRAGQTVSREESGGKISEATGATGETAKRNATITTLGSNVQDLPSVSLAAIYANEQLGQDSGAPTEDMAQSFLRESKITEERLDVSQEEMVSTLLEDDWMQEDEDGEEADFSSDDSFAKVHDEEEIVEPENVAANVERADFVGLSESVEPVGLTAFMQETRSELRSLKHQLIQQQNAFDEERELLLSTQNIEAARELYAMDVSLAVIKTTLRQIDRPHEASSTEAILQAFSRILPVIELPKLGESIYTVTGGRVADQSATLAKLVLHVAVKQPESRCVVVTVDKEHAVFERFELLTGIKVVNTDVCRLQDTINALASYTHIFVDVGYAGIDNDAKSGVVSGLAALRDLNLGHQEFLALNAAADVDWVRGLIDHWKSSSTLCCLLSESDSEGPSGLGQLVSLLIEKRLPIAGFVKDAVLPDAIESVSPGSLMTRLSQNRLMYRRAVAPVVY